MIKIGCCGFPVGREKYYKNLKVVELQQTFYQLPDEKLAKKWREEAPSDFEFTVKAWQLITHPPSSLTYRRLKEKIHESKKQNYGFFKPTKEVFEAFERTLRICEILGAKILIFQTPPSFKQTEENTENINTFFSKLKNCFTKITPVIELRGNWNTNTIQEICSTYKIIHCVDPLVNAPLYGDFNYFRLHGTYKGTKIIYNYTYTDAELKKIKSLCNKKLNYVMFNNISMYDDALRFQNFL